MLPRSRCLVGKLISCSFKSSIRFAHCAPSAATIHTTATRLGDKRDSATGTFLRINTNSENATPGSDSAAARQQVVDLIRSYERGRTLGQGFFTHSGLFAAEMQMWKRSWMFAGFECQIPDVGDYFLYSIGQDSVIVLRDDQHQIQAFANVCRHRGARLLTASSGNIKSRIVCPYHKWCYNTRNGRLMNAQEMEENGDFHKSLYSLQPVQLRRSAGLLYVSLSNSNSDANPSATHQTQLFDFEPAQKLIDSELTAYRLQDAKIAHSVTYTVKSNFKNVWTNNRECWHCAGSGHPEYTRATYDTSFIYQTAANNQTVRVLDPQHPRSSEAAEVIQYYNEHLHLPCSSDNSFGGEGWFRVTRQPLRRGFVTESVDGAPVCQKMLGQFDQQGKSLPLELRNKGSLRVYTFLNFWMHVSGDHAVSTRLTPIDETTTEARVDWLVHKDAVQGQDYGLDRLLLFWKRTSEQDWSLCERNEVGVRSSHYRTGPLSVRKESGVVKFLDWYIQTLSRCI